MGGWHHSYVNNRKENITLPHCSNGRQATLSRTEMPFFFTFSFGHCLHPMSPMVKKKVTMEPFDTDSSSLVLYHYTHPPCAAAYHTPTPGTDSSAGDEWGSEDEEVSKQHLHHPRQPWRQEEVAGLWHSLGAQRSFHLYWCRCLPSIWRTDLRWLHGYPLLLLVLQIRLHVLTKGFQ